MQRKGQAAMEFLMTYGWAILAAIIAIGVLAYFGVFNPGRLAGNQGLINPPFNLDNFRIDASDDDIIIEVTQNLGESINLVHTAAGASDGFLVKLQSPSNGACTMTSSSSPNVFTDTTPADAIGDNAWLSGIQHTITASCNEAPASANWAEGDQVRGEVSITYRTSGSALDQQSTGSLRGTSQA